MSARTRHRRPPSRAPAVFGVAVVAIGSAVLGVLLIRVSVLFEDAAPLVALGVPMAPLVGAAILNDPRLSVALVFASFPIGFAALPVGPFRLQATEIAILVAIVLVGLLRLGNARVPLLWPGRLLAAAGLIVWAIAVSFPAALDQAVAIKQLLSVVAGIVLVALIVTVCPDLRAVRLALGVLVAVAAFISANALLSAGTTHVFYAGAVVEGRAQGLFIEPNELGSFCSMVAVAATGLALGAQRAASRLLTSAALALILGALALSLSRGAWLGTAAGFGLMLITVTQARRAVLALAVPLVVGASILNLFLPENPQVQVLGERARVLTKLDQPYEGRPAIWSEALRQIRERPVTGQGPGNFGIASRRLAATGQTVYTGHAHNLYLNTAAELGLPGLALLLVFFAALAAAAHDTLRRLRQQARGGDRALVAAMAAGLLSFAVQGLTNTFIGNPIIDATVWGLAGFLLVAHREARQPAASLR